MDELFSCRAFAGFGPNRLEPGPPPPLFRARGSRPAALRRRIRQHCPRAPGVYGMIDANGALVYVGKAKCLRARLLSYFRKKSRDPKAGRIVEQARAVVWEESACEFAALLRELELIRRWQPRFNVQGQPKRCGRRYVCLGRRPAPHAFLAPQPPAGVTACFGPVPAGRKAGEAVRRLNDLFRLRDCPRAQVMVFADQQELFAQPRAAGCLRHEIGTCLGPCAAVCTQADYAAQVRAARAFLEGKDAGPLEALERDMTAAAAALEYERAADLRDRAAVLRWLLKEVGRVRAARQRHSFVYPVAGADGTERWYLIRHGRVTAAAAAPRDAETARAAAALVEAAARGGAAEPGPPAPEEVDGVLLVAAWFRRHPEERARVLTWDEARARCAACLPSGPRP
ncbi:MAG TPA: UvrB/UvrC motif-containing protein [Gemmataceae bacterium]|nr:UvrB/UvrC motif-containing protein [Gemmataceae bacterium]